MNSKIIEYTWTVSIHTLCSIFLLINKVSTFLQISYSKKHTHITHHSQQPRHKSTMNPSHLKQNKLISNKHSNSYIPTQIKSYHAYGILLALSIIPTYTYIHHTHDQNTYTTQASNHHQSKPPRHPLILNQTNLHNGATHTYITPKYPHHTYIFTLLTPTNYIHIKPPTTHNVTYQVTYTQNIHHIIHKATTNTNTPNHNHIETPTIHFLPLNELPPPHIPINTISHIGNIYFTTHLHLKKSQKQAHTILHMEQHYTHPIEWRHPSQPGPTLQHHQKSPPRI